MVREIDGYVESQVERYNNAQSVRKTAKEVASDTRRRKENG